MTACRVFRFFVLAAGLAASSMQAQQLTLPLWSNGSPEGFVGHTQEHDATTPSDPQPSGRRVTRLVDVTDPTLTVFRADKSQPNRPAVVVFPGGGYKVLAYDIEGTEVCAWLNSIRVNCVLVKYRVPIPGQFPERTEDLEDAQQAMRLTRSHAKEWGIDPKRVGVLGFSAGGHLATVLSNHFDFEPNSVNIKEHGGEGAEVSARPDFALLIYPAYLTRWSEPTTVSHEVIPSASTPPTFLLQAEDDPIHEENALEYFQALKAAKIQAELHIYGEGGHGYGLRPSARPISRWPVLAEVWLHTIGIIGSNDK